MRVMLQWHSFHPHPEPFSCQCRWSGCPLGAPRLTKRWSGLRGYYQYATTPWASGLTTEPLFANCGSGSGGTTSGKNLNNLLADPEDQEQAEKEQDKGLIQTAYEFFTRLWSPGSSDAQKLGYAYVYGQDGTLLGEYGMGGSNSTGTTQYIYLPTANGPMPIAAIVNGVAYAVHSDHLNTPRKLTQPDGQVAWQWAYSAFGDEQPTLASKRFTDATTNPTTGSTTIPEVTFNLRYPGQYYDKESNLHYNYFRSYSAERGRYTQADPIGLDGGFNRFGYVGGDALSRIDPKGLATPSDISIAIDIIRKYVPELYPIPPTSVTPVPGLSNWMGMSLQGYTDLQNNVQINGTLYGDCKTPVDQFLTTEFLQTMAHEMLHVQQSTFEKGLTHGTLHDQIDRNAEIIAEKVLNEFRRRRKLTPQDACTCSPK